MKRSYSLENIDEFKSRLRDAENEEHKILDLSEMKLTELPVLPQIFYEKVQCLFLGNNNITYINNLKYFKSLEVLDINSNKISQLINVPDTLVELSCNNNNLSELPLLPILERLNCKHNSITHIPKYPKLTHLLCSRNKITSLDVYDNLFLLDCHANNLIELKINNTLDSLYCNNNFDLKRLIVPDNCSLTHLNISNTSITTMPFIIGLMELTLNETQANLVPLQYIITNFTKNNGKVVLLFKNKFIGIQDNE